MENLTQPTTLKMPFAKEGDRNIIPVDNSDEDDPVAEPTEIQRADLINGFPPITGLKPADGGLPPERKDFNALGYLTTLYDYFYQAGGTFTFNQDIAVSIEGYPLGARLWYTGPNNVTKILRSTISNNYDDFVNGKTYNSGTGTWVDKSGIIGTTWIQDTPTMDDFTYFMNRWQLVQSLPGTPDPDTWYFIEETS